MKTKKYPPIIPFDFFETKKQKKTKKKNKNKKRKKQKKRRIKINPSAFKISTEYPNLLYANLTELGIPIDYDFGALMPGCYKTKQTKNTKKQFVFVFYALKLKNKIKLKKK